jgi:hypothetical protein
MHSSHCPYFHISLENWFQKYLEKHTELNYTYCWYHCLNKLILMYCFLEESESSLLCHYCIITDYSGALLCRHYICCCINIINYKNLGTIYYGCLSSTVGIVTGLRTGWYWVQILAEARDFSRLENIQTSSGAQPASYSMRSRILSWE